MAPAGRHRDRRVRARHLRFFNVYFHTINLVRMEMLKNNMLTTPVILAQARFIVTIEAKRFHLCKSLVSAQSQRAPTRKHLDCGRLQGTSQSSQSQRFRLFPSFEVLVCFLPKVKFSASCRRTWRVSRRRVWDRRLCFLNGQLQH